MEWASGCSVPDAEEENHSAGDCVIALERDEDGFLCDDRVHAKERRGGAPERVGSEADSVAASHLHQVGHLGDVCDNHQRGSKDSQPVRAKVMKVHAASPW